MNLLSSAAWTLDVLFFVIAILGIPLGVRAGFIKGICKIAGTVVAVAVAVLFCNAFSETLESWFSLTTALTDAIGNQKVAGWIAIAISFVALFLLVKIGAWLLGMLGTGVAEKWKVFDVINRLLGGVLGLFKALVLIFLLLTVGKWIGDWFSLSVIDEFFSSSAIVGKIYTWEWFQWATTFSFLSIG